MPRYYLHVVRDGMIRADDPEGGDFQDLAAAGTEARETARELAIQSILRSGRIDIGVIEVADEEGVVKLTVPLQQ